MRTLLATLLLCAIVSLAAAAEIKGNVPFVFDGTIFDIVTDQVRARIRVCGIDIPESGAPGSIEAKQFLEELILNKEVRVSERETAVSATVGRGQRIATA